MTAIYAVKVVSTVFYIYMMLLLVRVLSSWFPDIQDHPLLRFVAKYTDPYLNIFRNIVPPIGGVLDISPIIAFFALQLIESVVTAILLS